MAKSEMREWALKGAEQRLLEIAEEARAIFSAFPELRDEGRGFLSRKDAAATAGARKNTSRGTSGRRRGRRKMSAEARKRIGDAQRARWARQKSAGGGEASNGPSAEGRSQARSRKKR